MTAKKAPAAVSSSAPAHAEPHIPNVRAYMIVFGTLLVLTCLTVWVSHLELARPQAVAVGLFIATVKASLVAAFFMHLIEERTLIYSILGLTAVFCVMLYSIPIVDFVGNGDRITHTPILEEPVVEPQQTPVNQPGGVETPANSGEAQPATGFQVPQAKPQAQEHGNNPPPKKHKPAKKQPQP